MIIETQKFGSALFDYKPSFYIGCKFFRIRLQENFTDTEHLITAIQFVDYDSHKLYINDEFEYLNFLTYTALLAKSDTVTL